MTNYTNYIKQVNSFDALINSNLFTETNKIKIQTDKIQTTKIKTDKTTKPTK